MKIRFSIIIALFCAILACGCGGRGSSSSSSSRTSQEELIDKDGDQESDDSYRSRRDDDGGYARRGRKKGSLSEVFDRVIKDNVRDDVREEEIDEEGDAYRSYRQSVMEDEEDEIDEEGDAYRSYRQSVMEDEEGVLGGETKRFSGAIMSKDKKKSYNIYLEVVESGTDGSVSGHYRYLSQPADRTIPLFGKVIRNGDVLRFKLFSTGGTEAFEFKGEDGDALSGTWRQYKTEADRDAGTSPSKELVVFLTE